jgi:hypothetical protein
VVARFIPPFRRPVDTAPLSGPPAGDGAAVVPSARPQHSPIGAAALDPHVRIYVTDGKGGQDWEAWETVADRYASGADVEDLVRGLEELKAEMRKGEC